MRSDALRTALSWHCANARRLSVEASSRALTRLPAALHSEGCRAKQYWAGDFLGGSRCRRPCFYSRMLADAIAQLMRLQIPAFVSHIPPSTGPPGSRIISRWIHGAPPAPCCNLSQEQAGGRCRRRIPAGEVWPQGCARTSLREMRPPFLFHVAAQFIAPKLGPALQALQQYDSPRADAKIIRHRDGDSRSREHKVGATWKFTATERKPKSHPVE
jgi:hypothetical protein